MRKKIAVILFNLGGPDSLTAVKPFLFNLFNDPAIINLPNPFRFLLAKLISGKRDTIAQDIYRKIGGKSPIVELTLQQAKALEKKLEQEAAEYKTFISMRYWHPFSEQVAKQVKQYAPDEVILLPLYPQYSTTTTASSVKDWQKSAIKAGISASTKILCCYPNQESFIQAHVGTIRPTYMQACEQGKVRLLFSAHGLPKKVVDKGDPYQWQVEQTVDSIVKQLEIPNLDYQVCYQSKVGRLEWIGPSTDEEIVRAGKDNKVIVMIPIAFVSEHSETLVELDIEYQKMANQYGVPGYYRIPALGTEQNYIQALADMCRYLLEAKEGICPPNGKRLCPRYTIQCPIGI